MVAIEACCRYALHPESEEIHTLVLLADDGDPAVRKAAVDPFLSFHHLYLRNTHQHTMEKTRFWNAELEAIRAAEKRRRGETRGQ